VLVVRGPNFSAPVFGAIEEIHAALSRLTEAGKAVYYYASEYEMTDCCLASACTKRMMHPLGTLAFRGTARTDLFFRNALEKHKIGVSIIRKGSYKSAASAFQNTAYDEFDRAQKQRLLDVSVEFCRNAVIQSGMMAQEMLDALLDGDFLSAEAALQKEIIDGMQLPDSLTAEWKKNKQKPVKTKKVRQKRKRNRNQIAVLFHEGAIAEGKNRTSPLLGQVIGDEAMVREIQKLEKNKRVKAAVFRINSGGGSAAASENILQALKSLAEKKPLAVSMGPVAGSGGYWIAGAGRRIFADSTTVTGSIGVISLFFELQELLSSFGITADTIKQGKSADFGSTLRNMTDEEQKRFEDHTGRIYQEFIKRTAAARNMAEKDVAEIAEGRVWIGTDAVQNGLIDEIGGLREAVDWIKRETALRRSRTVYYPVIKKPFIQRLLMPDKEAAFTAQFQDTSFGSAAWSAGNAALLYNECRQLSGRPMAIVWDWFFDA